MIATFISHNVLFILLLIRLPICNLSCIRMHAEIRQIFLFVGAVSLSGCWLYYRKEHFSWVLQDILGVAFRYFIQPSFEINHNLNIFLLDWSINMIRQVRLPSLKICTLLLVMLFFYDIFFVFITPLLTKVILESIIIIEIFVLVIVNYYIYDLYYYSCYYDKKLFVSYFAVNPIFVYYSQEW